MRFRFIEDRRVDYPVKIMCDVLGVSRAGYYAWRSRPESARSAENRELLEDIQQIHSDNRGRYGSPRIHVELKAQGHGVSRGRVERLMRRHGIHAIMARPRRARTTDSRHDHPIAPNLIKRDFTAAAPNLVWLADITYIDTDHGWLYLAAILDLYSRKIVGWAMGERNDTVLVLKALAMALLHRNPPAKLLFHSDRGVQYASGDYRQALNQAGLVASMSRRGNCYDNATMESFWSTLKLELVYRQSFDTRAAARTQIFDYIETFYNRHRTHSALDYHSPVDFELLNN